jgi:hypothetical protein
LWKSLTAEDEIVSEKARKDLASAAGKVADELRTNRDELEFARHMLVQLLPKALGAAARTGLTPARNDELTSNEST